MNVMGILPIVIAALVGAVVTYFVVDRKKNGKENNDTSLEEVIKKKYESMLSEIQSKIIQKDALLKEEYIHKEETRKKYEELLSDAQSKIAQLDAELKGCINGHIDETVQKQLDNVDKLKKRIKDLEEEIEENGDDLADYKKKLKKKDDEKSELQDLLDKEVKIGKGIKEELEKLKSELDDKKNELEFKMESLRFVQEVVLASVVKDSATKVLYSNVDNAVNYISGELREGIKEVFTLDNEKEIFGSELKKWALSTKKSWIQHKTVIAFVGEFSAGKTSIVNRILSQDDPNVPLLPVSAKATTAIPTYISGGESTRYSFVTPDNVQKTISEETFRRVNKEVLDEIKGVSSLIQYFVMTYRNRNLDRLSILDTPGFSSNDSEDAQRTIDVINECDALFWVFDVNSGTVNKSSIQLIKKNLKKPLYVVINKVDTKPDTEVNKVEQLIRKTLRDEGVSVQKFVRFSAKAPIEDIMTPIKSVPKDMEQESYIANLLNLVTNFAERLERDSKEANRKQNNLFEKCDHLCDKYNSAIQRLGNNCLRASEIPHLEKHLFRKDGYEMSIDEYNDLVNTLNLICDDNVEELCDLYNQQMEAKCEAQQAYLDYIDKKEMWKKMDAFKTQLKKVVKPFN
ncbi:dynamin family protein [Bacteroides difficilis]|uniref:Dynamin family protein n=1 Tax=Bacteroides difficilis TaxID=2763021 RepID=A0ABR7CG32_9BACE|nr:dynamin family protein [Bacteroides difficilis]MBC5606723.1 dynamin family protein [Bacteroides difficilis]